MSYIRTAQDTTTPTLSYRTAEEERVGLKHVLKPFAAWLKAFSTPYTVPKGESLRPASDNYRGWHVNDVETCTGCGNCAAICMNVAIDMTPYTETTMKDTGLRPRIDYGRCCWCGLCVDVCAASSLGLSDCYVWIGDDADGFRFTPGVDAKPWDASQRGWRKQKKAKEAA
jgi:glutamate synthase (NADPH/NADH) small chain